MMKPEQLASIKARRAAMAPGPWLGPDKLHIGRRFGARGKFGRFAPNEEAFIRHAASDVDTLVAEVDRLRGIEAAVVALFARHGGGDIEEFDGIVALRAAIRAAGIEE